MPGFPCTLTAALFAGCAVLASPAMAQADDAASDFTVSGNAAILSEYRDRGVDYSGGDPAIQGGIDLGHSSGFYVGAWGTSLDEKTVGYGHTELDLYGGWTGHLAEGLTADLGANYSMYPNADPGDFDYVELYGSFGFTLGPAEATAGLFYAPSQSSLGDADSLYLYGELGTGIPGTPLSLLAHLGYTDGSLAYTADGDAFDWSLGASYALTGDLSVGATYVGSDGAGLPGYDFMDDALVATLSIGF